MYIYERSKLIIKLYSNVDYQKTFSPRDLFSCTEKKDWRPLKRNGRTRKTKTI